MKVTKTVVIGVTSGIAAYKVIDLIKLLRKDGNNVIVVMTKSATFMVPKEAFEKASGNKVYAELFEKDFNFKKVLASREVDHIKIADMADLVIIAPATANTIAKMAYGMADDFLTTMLLATQAPILVCPSMNVHMWGNQVVVENVQKLRTRGMHILEPEEGDLACGYRGKGRLAHIFHIQDEITSLLQKKEPASQRGEQLRGKKIIVTAGGTIEPIDGVRFIANKSSGKMGIAIAESCFLQGADVLLVRSKTSVSPRYNIKQIVFETADELAEILKKEVKKYDVLFQAAAISDFTLDQKIYGKLDSKKDVFLQLKVREKIISNIKLWNSKIKLIAFKAVWNGVEKILIKEGEKKLNESNADAIVVNDVSRSDRGFGTDTNEVIVIKKDKTKKKITLRSKKDVAEEIIKYIFTSSFW